MKGERMGQPQSLIRHGVWNADMYIACAALAVLVAITISGVVMRYLVNSPFRWTEEVQLMCFVWVIFFGACSVARNHGHIAIDAFVNIFPKFLRKSANFISNAISILLLVYLGYQSCRHTLQMYNSNRLTPILAVPYAFIYVAVPLSCLVMTLAYAWRLACSPKTEGADV